MGKLPVNKLLEIAKTDPTEPIEPYVELSIHPAAYDFEQMMLEYHITPGDYFVPNRLFYDLFQDHTKEDYDRKFIGEMLTKMNFVKRMRQGVAYYGIDQDAITYNEYDEIIGIGKRFVRAKKARKEKKKD